MSIWAISAHSFIQFPNNIFDIHDNSHVKTSQKITTPHIVSVEILQQQRKLFLKAELSLQLSHFKTFQQQLSKLGNYPLKPYLIYKNMRRQLGSLSQQSIDNFFTHYPKQILSYRLRHDLIRYYEKNQRWQDLLNIYSTQNSTRLQCAYLQALIKTGQSERAFSQIKSLWLSGHSQPRNCDSVFNAWSKAGFKTDDLIWQRIELAIKKNKPRLAKYLSHSLDAGEKKWVDLWIKVRHKPALIEDSALLNSSHPYAKKITLYALKRLSQRDPQAAANIWLSLSQRIHFNHQETSQAHRIIGLAMAQEHNPQANDWLQKIDDKYADSYILEWRIRNSIRSADWPSTLQHIEALSIKKQANLRWQFWWAYSNAQLGNLIEADSTFRYLASRRSYYGFLAADQLNLPYAFENKPLQLKAPALFHISQQAAALRAHELYRLGRILDARREWYQLTLKLNATEKLAASKLAQQWQWHDRAIYTMGQTRYRDDIILRFPLTLQKTIQSWSLKRQIDSAWTYAIIRRESAFMSDARSPAGALGLMQLMPNTARQVAHQMQVRYSGKNSLLSSETNIKLGTGYLEKMLARNQQQTVLATAAYNAGPHRVENWLPKHQPMEAIRWIETIPFTETREYVSNVLAYTIIYRHLLGASHTRLTEQMPLIPSRSKLAQAENKTIHTLKHKS